MMIPTTLWYKTWLLAADSFLSYLPPVTGILRHDPGDSREPGRGMHLLVARLQRGGGFGSGGQVRHSHLDKYCGREGIVSISNFTRSVSPSSVEVLFLNEYFGT